MSKISRRQALTMLGTAGATIAFAPTLSLAGEKPIICGWDSTFTPYSMKKGNGMTGILVDCINEIMVKRMSLPVENRSGEWADIQDLVRAGHVDALCTNPTESRREFMLFCETPVVESLPSIFCAKDNPKLPLINQITKVEELADYRQVDYAGNGWAHETFPPTQNITWTRTLTDAFNLIIEGKADIFVGNSLAGMYTLHNMGIKDRFRIRNISIGTPSCFHFGLRRNYPDAAGLIARFSDTLDMATLDGAINQIIKNYL